MNKLLKGLYIPSERKDANHNMVKVLDAAKIRFAVKGWDATIEEIAQEAGVGIGTVYRRFANKSQLALAVITDILSTFTTEQERLANSNYTAEEKIKLIYGYFSTLSNEYGKLGSMVIDLINTDNEFGQLKNSILTHLRGMIRQVIAQGLQEGSFRNIDPRVLEAFIFHVASPQFIYELKQFVPLPEIDHLFVALILKGISK